MPERMTPERLAEIQARYDREAGTLDGWVQDALHDFLDELPTLREELRLTNIESFDNENHADEMEAERDEADARAEQAEARVAELERAINAGPLTGPQAIESWSRAAQRYKARAEAAEAEVERLRELSCHAFCEGYNFGLSDGHPLNTAREPAELWAEDSWVQEKVNEPAAKEARDE